MCKMPFVALELHLYASLSSMTSVLCLFDLADSRNFLSISFFPFSVALIHFSVQKRVVLKTCVSIIIEFEGEGS